MNDEIRLNLVKTSYKEEDVTILLKDITGKASPMSQAEREKAIQSGVHYSEMLPVEYSPTEEYLRLYDEALDIHSKRTAEATVKLAELIWSEKKGKPVLVSLARAGTPIGVLLKRYLEERYGKSVPHYSISIIRDKGIDHNAMKYILNRHNPEELQFIDGWVGKGTIATELKKEIGTRYSGVDSRLAVLADPAGITELTGTREDFLIPSSCLNAPVSGLFSRSVLSDTFIGETDFHGAASYCEELKNYDRTYQFIDTVFWEMQKVRNVEIKRTALQEKAEREIAEIAGAFAVEDINLIKPGIGETTRVLMRRVPRIILVRDVTELSYVGHILRLCREKNIEVLEYPLVHYRVCGIIKNMKDL